MKSIWGDKYDYSKVVYVNAKTKTELICSEHGSFWRTPNDIVYHRYQESICPRCSVSEGEVKIENFLKENDIEYDPQKVFEDLYGTSNKTPHPLKFDFYLPSYNLCIEYQGQQHYRPIKRFGGQENFIKIQLYDQMKRNYCEENKISLLEVKYDIPLEKIKYRLEELFNKIDFKEKSFHMEITNKEEIITLY